MYGTDAGVTTTGLAMTGVGLQMGSMFLAGVGMLLGGIAVWMLVRRESKVKP